jgi:hypothetical protein
MDVIASGLDAVAHRDWVTLRAIHPYLHWTEGSVTIRRRTKVLAHLAEHPVSDQPRSYELRDGQVYRWTV